MWLVLQNERDGISKPPCWALQDLPFIFQQVTVPSSSDCLWQRNTTLKLINQYQSIPRQRNSGNDLSSAAGMSECVCKFHPKVKGQMSGSYTYVFSTGASQLLLADHTHTHKHGFWEWFADKSNFNLKTKAFLRQSCSSLFLV